MPETRPKTDTAPATGSTEEAHADALAQAWSLPRPANDLWPNIEQALESDRSVSPEVAASAERAKRQGIPFVDLEKHYPEPSAIACVSADLARHYRLVPVRKDANRLFVALENPRDITALDAIRLHSGLMVQPMLAPMSQIAAAIKQCYPLTDAADERGAGHAPIQEPLSANPLNEILTELKTLREEVGALRREVAQLRRSERKPEFGAALLPFITADDLGLPLG